MPKIPKTSLDWKNLEFMYHTLHVCDGDIGTILFNWPDKEELDLFINDYIRILRECGVYNHWKF